MSTSLTVDFNNFTLCFALSMQQRLAKIKVEDDVNNSPKYEMMPPQCEIMSASFSILVLIDACIPHGIQICSGKESLQRVWWVTWLGTRTLVLRWATVVKGNSWAPCEAVGIKSYCPCRIEIRNMVPGLCFKSETLKTATLLKKTEPKSDARKWDWDRNEVYEKGHLSRYPWSTGL